MVGLVNKQPSQGLGPADRADDKSDHIEPARARSNSHRRKFDPFERRSRKPWFVETNLAASVRVAVGNGTAKKTFGSERPYGAVLHKIVGETGFLQPLQRFVAPSVFQKENGSRLSFRHRLDLRSR